MVLFVFVLQAAQDRNGILDRRLRDEDRLEPPRQCGILLDMLRTRPAWSRRYSAISPRASAGFRRLDASIATVGLAGAIKVCISSMNRMMLPSGRGDLLQHGFQPFLELAAVFRTRNQRTQIERQQFLSLRLSGTSPLTMRTPDLRRSRSLPTPGSPIRTGLFLVRRERT